ncbi:MAG: tetratricopeptide repeat protein [Sterolibacteriaceae bacterium]|nr:tetratricopeptide repeat protein [Sterolibacteriaceae bacterium]
MSLLMDALKKAELAKRQGHAEDTGDAKAPEGAGELSLKPLTEPDFTDSTLALPEVGVPTPAVPSQSSQFEELDARFLAEAELAATARLKGAQPVTPAPQAPGIESSPRPLSVAATEPRKNAPEKNSTPPTGKTAAQNLFAAKQADTTPARKTFAVVVGAITVLAICGIGGYFWWQLQPKSSLVASRGPLPSAPIAATAAPAAVSPAPTSVASPIAAAPAAPVTVTAAGKRAPDDDEEDAAATTTKPVARVRRPSTLAVPPQDEDSPIRVTKVPLKVNPSLIKGFDAFNRGDLAAAQLEYERAQKADPRNPDALHGLAAIALRQGRMEQAEQIYRRIAEADPQDTVAQAALINSRGQADPGAAESRLKTLAATQPDLAAPHFSLGNLYARHGRWNEAQQSYFRAHTAEPDNPDILYNLAISLEHLRQNKLAAQYYGQAIAAAQNRPAGFDKAQAAARLKALQP